ncbi:hypothetical protein WI664_19115 [Vibrio cholerae]
MPLRRFWLRGTTSPAGTSVTNSTVSHRRYDTHRIICHYLVPAAIIGRPPATDHVGDGDRVLHRAGRTEISDMVKNPSTATIIARCSVIALADGYAVWKMKKNGRRAHGEPIGAHHRLPLPPSPEAQFER